MNDYIKPSLKYEPDLLILHCGTNNLHEETTPDKIAEEIIKSAVNMKTDKNEVMISSLTFRKDKLQHKVQQVNDYLKIKSSKVNLGFVDNNNLNREHFNPKGIHLNLKGSEVLANNFINAINV